MKPDQVMFAVAPRGDGVEVDVLLGVPTEAWEYMKDGKTHTFDLTKLGLPIRIIMCGGKDHPEIRRWIDAHNRSLGVVGTQERTSEDFSIKPPEKPA